MKIHLLFLLLLTSCSSIDFNIPQTSFLNPETAGQRWHGYAELNLHESHEVNLITDSATRLPKNEPKVVRSHISTGGAVGLGIFKRWDLFLENDYDSPTVVGAKWQFYGVPFKFEEAPVKGFKAAIAVAAGRSHDREEENEVKSASDTRIERYDVRLPLGQRLNEHVLVYSTLNYAHYHASGSTTNSYQNTTRYSGRGDSFGVSAGTKLDFMPRQPFFFYLKMEAHYGETHWSNANRLRTGYGSMALGFNY